MRAGNSRAQKIQKSSMRIISPNLTPKQIKLSSTMALSMVWAPWPGPGWRNRARSRWRAGSGLQRPHPTGCGSRRCSPASRRGRYAPVVGRLQTVGVAGQRAVARRRRPLLTIVAGQPFQPALTLQVAPAEVAQPQPEGLTAIIIPERATKGAIRRAMRSLSQPPAPAPAARRPAWGPGRRRPLASVAACGAAPR